MNRAVVCIGSNLTPRRQYLEKACRWLRSVLTDVDASCIYETPEYHGIGRPYLNMVAAGYTTETYETLNMRAKAMEAACGRDDAARSRGDVPLDIDIVIWNHDIIRPGDFNQQFFKIGVRQIGIPEMLESQPG